MSEWYSCPYCHANRENGCACPNSQCVDGVDDELVALPDLANPLVRLRHQVVAYMQELENRDVTKMTITELIELKMAVCLVQNSGIDASHAVERMIRRWKEKHRPQELRDFERYQREENERACRPNPLAQEKVKEPNDWTRVYAGGTEPQHAAVLSEIDQTP